MPKYSAPRRRISKKRLAQLLDCSTDTIDRRVRAGKLPAPFRDGGRDYWFEDIVNTYNATLQSAAETA